MTSDTCVLSEAKEAEKKGGAAGSRKRFQLAVNFDWFGLTTTKITTDGKRLSLLCK